MTKASPKAAPAVTPEQAADAAVAIADAVVSVQSAAEVGAAMGIDVQTSTIAVEDNTDKPDAAPAEPVAVEEFELPGGILRTDY